MATVTEEQRQHYRTHGWLLVDDLLGITPTDLQAEIDRIAGLDDADVLHHRERTDLGPALARTENFLTVSPILDAALRHGAVAEVAGELLGEPALLYKEKINYKLVGGAGFAPHQDQPAYPFVSSVISVMIAVDDATVDNGCLEVVSGRHHELLEQDNRGCIAAEVVSMLDFQPAPLRAGQTLFFHSLTPHRSFANTSNANRRALFPTYNGISEGELHDAYYAAKRAAFEEADPGTRVRLSLIGDFEGIPL
jgi:hypothetical protein